MTTSRGFRRDQDVRTEPERLQLPRAQVLDHDIGGIDESMQEGGLLRVLQVQFDRALVASDDLPEEGHVVTRITPPHGPDGITGTRAFDLDDVGTEVREVARAPRPGDHRRQVDHPEIRQGPVGSGVVHRRAGAGRSIVVSAVEIAKHRSLNVPSAYSA